MKDRSILLKWFLAVCVILLMVTLYYYLWFLRMPDRVVPMDTATLVSPANGRVVSVVEWDSSHLALDKDLGVVRVLTDDVAEKGWLISIEMDITHVHYQRAPYSARLIGEKYVHGKFNNALVKTNRFGFRMENEHHAMLFETDSGWRFKVVQIAGLVARRIVDYIEPGQQVTKGDVIGLIKLGSQVTIILPSEILPIVHEGDMVIDGETSIANIPAHL